MDSSKGHARQVGRPRPSQGVEMLIIINEDSNRTFILNDAKCSMLGLGHASLVYASATTTTIKLKLACSLSTSSSIGRHLGRTMVVIKQTHTHKHLHGIFIAKALDVASEIDTDQRRRSRNGSSLLN